MKWTAAAYVTAEHLILWTTPLPGPSMNKDIAEYIWKHGLISAPWSEVQFMQRATNMLTNATKAAAEFQLQYYHDINMCSCMWVSTYRHIYTTADKKQDDFWD